MGTEIFDIDRTTLKGQQDNVRGALQEENEEEKIRRRQDEYTGDGRSACRGQ